MPFRKIKTPGVDLRIRLAPLNNHDTQIDADSSRRWNRLRPSRGLSIRPRRNVCWRRSYVIPSTSRRLSYCPIMSLREYLFIFGEEDCRARGSWKSRGMSQNVHSLHESPSRANRMSRSPCSPPILQANQKKCQGQSSVSKNMGVGGPEGVCDHVARESLGCVACVFVWGANWAGIHFFGGPHAWTGSGGWRPLYYRYCSVGLVELAPRSPLFRVVM